MSKSRGRRPKKATKKSPSLKPVQFRILSRPSSSGKDSLQSTPDLSEFEAPPNPPEDEIEGPNDDGITTNARKPSRSESSEIQLAENSSISVLPGKSGEKLDLNSTCSALVKWQEPNPADANIMQTTIPLPQSEPVAVDTNTKGDVSALQWESVQTTQPDPTIPSEAKTAELHPGDKSKMTNPTPVSPTKPNSTVHTHRKTHSGSSRTPWALAQKASQSQAGEGTKLEPTLSFANKDMATSNASTAQPEPIPIAETAKSNASALEWRSKEAATYGTANHSAVMSTPQAKKVDSTPRPYSRPNPMTPLKKNVTPAQACYAGPTFLASPAASSLPKPKFLSKSVPDKQKIPNLKAAMENQTGKLPLLDGNGDSPTLRKSKLNGEFNGYASAAQDFFSQESRAETLQASRNDDSDTSSEDSGADSPSLVMRRPASSSLSSANHISYHSRHATEGSTGGLFPMEMGDRNSPSPKPRQELHWDRQSHSTAHPDSFTTRILNQSTMNEEQRKAKTLALKKLLRVPDLQSGKDFAGDSEALKRSQYRGFPPSPGQAEPEATKTLTYEESDSSSAQMKRPQYRAFNSEITSKKEQFPEHASFLQNVSGPSTTPSSPGTRPTNQYQMSQLIPHTLEKSFVSKLAPNGPARSHSSPSNLAQQATIPKMYNHTNLYQASTGPTSIYRDNSCSSPAPWNQTFSQYRDISPFAPSVLSSHSSYFCFDKKPIRDPEVSRSMGEYLQRVISSS